MTSRVIAVLLSIMLICLVGGVVQAEGGAYIEDVVVTNNGQNVFFDNFNSGNLSKWTNINDAQMFYYTPNIAQYCLFLNKQHEAPATATHAATIENPGRVEFRSYSSLTPSEEQYDWQKRGACQLSFAIVSASSPDKVVRCYAYLNPLQHASNAGISTSRTATGTITTKAIIDANKWMHYRMIMDPKTRTATFYLDGSRMASTKYNPDDFRSIGALEITTSFGDGKYRK